MNLRTLVYTCLFSSLLASCNKEEANTGDTGNKQEEVVEKDKKIVSKSFNGLACSYFENQLPKVLNIGPADILNECANIDNQFGAKTSFVIKGVGTGFYLSALENKLETQKDVDVYYDKFMAIPQKEIMRIEGIGEGSIWMVKEKMLAFSKSGQNIVIVSNSKEGPEDYDLEIAKKVATDLIAFYQL